MKNPKYGYGSAMNPCMDCKIYFFKIAKKLMGKIGASFIVTGEVLGQRPMSQMKRQIELIERKSGLSRLIVRPLCVKLFPQSIPERKGIIDRSKLLGISGRSRKIQMKLAKKYKLKYSSPGGGCILTDANFARKLRDLFAHKKRITVRDVQLLKIGRHFRIDKSKIIVGRNEDENRILASYGERMKKMEVIDYVGPITIIENPTKNAISIAADLTAYYSDAKHSRIGSQISLEYNSQNIKTKLKSKKYINDLVEKHKI